MAIVALIEKLVEEILSAEEDFLNNPKDLHSLEACVKSSTESFAAAFLGEVLTDLNAQIFNSSWRKGKYVSQRQDKRTIISSVGDVTFDCTYYKGIGKCTGFTHLVEDVIGLNRNERFTEDAEAAILKEAVKTSYAEAAMVLPSKQKITKATVLNKVHGIVEEIPDLIYDEPKAVPYLFIEADEDHVAEQHGRENKADNKSFISKLVYIYEHKQGVPGVNGRNELVNKYYFGGLYTGTEGTKRLWEKVCKFIDTSYDSENIKKIFISGDAAPWIKSGTNYIPNSVFCADKYHLMQYINTAAAQMGDEKDLVKNELWHILNSRRKGAKKRFDQYTQEMMACARRPEKVEQLRTYVLGNWGAVRRTLSNELVKGCSAESHVSHVLSDRLSSRPMGWSQTGADRMSKLRCYERNRGSEKIIDLVKYRREHQVLAATGTEDITPNHFQVRDVIADHYDQSKSYIERLQAHLVEGTAKKTATIRGHLWAL